MRFMTEGPYGRGRDDRAAKSLAAGAGERHAARMTQRWFLKLDGIPGDSTDVAHKDWIDVQSWSWGVANSGSTAPTGGAGGAGKATFQDLTVAAHLGSASPSLFVACATGKHVKEATLSGVTARATGKGFEFLTIRLRDVVVTGQQLGDSLGVAPGDQFSLTYARIDISYVPQSPSGGASPPVTAGYDLKAATKV
jgi:type VI secretion system secreted protein Hcp